MRNSRSACSRPRRTCSRRSRRTPDLASAFWKVRGTGGCRHGHCRGRTPRLKMMQALSAEPSMSSLSLTMKAAWRFQRGSRLRPARPRPTRRGHPAAGLVEERGPRGWTGRPRKRPQLEAAGPPPGYAPCAAGFTALERRHPFLRVEAAVGAPRHILPKRLSRPSASARHRRACGSSCKPFVANI